MNHKIKRKWVAALRGGTWEQVRGLFDKGQCGRCAVGVLLEIIGLGKNDYHIKDSDVFIAELSRRSGSTPFQRNTIHRMNDSQGKSFSEIADYIEEHL